MPMIRSFAPSTVTGKKVSVAPVCGRVRRQQVDVKAFFFRPSFNKVDETVRDVVKPEPVAAEVKPSTPAPAPGQANPRNLEERQRIVQEYFPNALSVDDFITRVEIALCKYGFTGDNCIACTNLCRDEITTVLKDKIEAVFGSSFNTNGLGGVLTCGVTGIGAGLSHSPVCTNDGRERYVFFSFPHIAIGADGELGAITRPGRAAKSCACGALIKCLGELKGQGVAENCRTPGVHDAEDPEYSILKQRLARRIRYEEQDVATMDLAEITKVAERTITDDLEYLIEKAVNVEKADFAVVTGVEIHNWAPELGNGVPSLEFVAPSKVYACVNGRYSYIDLREIPSLTPRQIALMAEKSLSGAVGDAGGIAGSGLVTSTSTIKDIPASYLAKRIGRLSGAEPGTVRIKVDADENSTATPPKEKVAAAAK